ncbi:HAMP domain-containing protein [Streptosporangium sp. NBC_01495]|uniref:HAMP domain-containing sensor histidine kinase n=1 Tax=Streptosporangium sp. NBC_01495 TaxID=2903899 RepID=UPI002E3199A7|nr:ATP-binding protein [Streptosporangium sp. NBC_01495]
MAASYVLVTATAVLVVEAVLLGIYVPTITSGSDLRNRVQEQAGKDAKILSLAVSDVTVPHEHMTDLLNVVQEATRRQTALHGSTSGELGIVATDGPVTDLPVEVLTDRTGAVITGSAPGVFPPGSRLDVTIPPQGGGGSGKTRTGPVTWWLSPVLIPPPDRIRATAGPAAAPEYEIAGYVYVQAPVGYGDSGYPADYVENLLTPGGLVLILVVPVGLVFGLLSTRRLIGRVRHLANVTEKVARGDFRPRVPVLEGDEVGRLEESFNRMTERLESALTAERAAGQVEARQAERVRIARELHDSISQDLFSLSLLAAGMRRAAPDRLRREAESMERTATRAMREMQALLLELRPVALEDAGLSPAIEELCRAYETRLGLRVHTRLDDVALGPATEHAVLRLVQEALGNAVRHADPGLVEIRLTRDGETARVEIHDDGTGFDPATATAGHGIGLRLMRERVEELGGAFTLTTAPGHGTTVVVTLPSALVPS